MPDEDEKLVNTRWLVRVGGCDGEIEVTAAYVQTGGDRKIHSIDSGDSHVTTLKNAAHKIVFQSPCVVYARRDDSTSLATA